MPINKNSFLRYQVIDACLNNKFRPYPTIEVLIEKCSEKLGVRVSKSTIEKDIHAMKYLDPPGFDAPIEFDRTHQGYYYNVAGYTIVKINIKDEDIDAIEFAAKVLRQYRGFHIVKRYAEAIDRILDVVDVRRILSREELEEYVQFETPTYVEGTQYIEQVIRAIQEKQVLKLFYRAFYKDKPEIRIVHPYLLKEFRNRWYLVGLDDNLNELRTFGLDRIVSIEKGLKTGQQSIEEVLENQKSQEVGFKSNIDRPEITTQSSTSEITFRKIQFNPQDYFRNTVGIIAPQSKPSVIKLSFSKVEAQYIITQPIHESQKIVKVTKNRIIFTFLVHPTYEFVSLLLGYQDGVKVLAPKELKIKMKEILTLMINNYKGAKHY
jgi:predicted DNA-binding transcriptional regulator YafY